MTGPGTDDLDWDLSGLLVEINPPPGGLDRLRRRARHQRRTRRSVIAVAAAVVMIAVSFGVASLTGGHHPPGSVNVVGEPPAQTTIVVAPAPQSATRGARPLDWGYVRVWLPAAWTRSGMATDCHSQGFTELVAVTGVGLAPCHYLPGRSALTISKLPGTPPAGGRRTAINGIAVIEYPAQGNAAPTTVDVPSLHVQMTAGTTAARNIIATLQHSVAYDLLAGRGVESAPPDWQRVVWDGISLDVPAGWRIERAHYEPCNSLGSGQSDVVRGPLDFASGCTGEAFATIPTTEGGASIDAGYATPAIGPTLIEHHGPLTIALAAAADTPAGISIHVTGGARPVFVELAIGSSVTTAAEVIGSIETAGSETGRPLATATSRRCPPLAQKVVAGVNNLGTDARLAPSRATSAITCSQAIRIDHHFAGGLPITGVRLMTFTSVRFPRGRLVWVVETSETRILGGGRVVPTSTEPATTATSTPRRYAYNVDLIDADTGTRFESISGS